MKRLSRPAVIRLLRYLTVGVSTLGFDLLLLFTLTEYVHMPYYIATPSAFLVAVSINYLVSRRFVFRGTKRRMHTGYAYFLVFAFLGAGITTLGVALLVTYAHLYFLVARILIAGCVGIGTYLGNLFLNFKVVGTH